MSNIAHSLLAILVPPVAGFFTVGIGGQFWINILQGGRALIGLAHAVLRAKEALRP